MDDPVAVRNSRGLTVFAEIVRGPAGTLRAVELAGRGIAAQARCELSIPVTDKLPHDIPADHIMRDAMAFADRVGELILIENTLAGLWRRRSADEISDAVFEAELEQAICRLEAWPGA